MDMAGFLAGIAMACIVPCWHGDDMHCTLLEWRWHTGYLVGMEMAYRVSYWPCDITQGTLLACSSMQVTLL
jgi:hypothetical protein